MSKLVTLKTLKKNRFNRSCKISGYDCKFDKFGMVEVPERYVKEMIDAGLETVDEEDVKKYSELKAESKDRAKENPATVDVYDENQKLKMENAKLTTIAEELQKRIDTLELQLLEKLGAEPGTVVDEPVVEVKYDEAKAKEIAEILKDQKLGEMKDFCKEQKLPENEWVDFTKKDDIRAYLVKKLSIVE